MVFSSIPAYLDPSNWNQQQNHPIIGSSSGNPLLPPPPHPGPTPPPPPSQPHGGGGGSIRPGSMAERARMANIPLPETSLKCPRCESTNTKFCYFNNYSLSQPRHFCKTCRRYWTRGGALRNVPVGGGCRRNKRTKSSSTSKSPASSDRSQTNATSTSTVSTNSGGGGTPNLLGLTPPQFPPLRFMSPLGQFTDNFAADMGLNSYTGMASSTAEMSFHGAANLLGGGVSSLLSNDCGGGIEPWRLQQVQQFPFLGGGIDTSSQGIYQFHGGGEPGFLGGDMRPRFSSPMGGQRPPLKMEDSSERRQILGGGNEQWNGGSAANWTELSSFSSSSTSNPL